MTKLNVNIGLSVNDKTGDTLRSAFDKINQNFTELYSAIGADVQIPIQTGNNGKYLTTNGATLSWATVSSVTTSTTAPTSPALGDLWYDTESGRTYVYYDSTWVDSSPVDGNPDLGDWAFKNNSLYSLSGGYIDNSDTEHGATAGLTIPTNGDDNPIVLSNAYGNVVLVSGASPGALKTWNFGTEGKLTLPAGTTYEYLNAPLTGHGDGLARLDFTLVTDGVNAQWAAASASPAGSGYSPGDTFTFDAEFLGIPGASVTIEVLTVGAGGSVENLGFSQPPLYPADIYRDSPINLQVGPESNRWTFGHTGNLTTPGDIQLGADSYLRFPDSSFQGTAFVGDASRLYGNVDQDVDIIARPPSTVTATTTFDTDPLTGQFELSEPFDIYAVQAGWEMNTGTEQSPIWSTVSNASPNPGEYWIYLVADADFLFAPNTAYTFRNPTPVLRTWTFGTDGTLTLPNSATLAVGSEAEIIALTLVYTDYRDQLTDVFAVANYTGDGYPASVDSYQQLTESVDPAIQPSWIVLAKAAFDAYEAVFIAQQAIDFKIDIYGREWRFTSDRTNITNSLTIPENTTITGIDNLELTVDGNGGKTAGIEFDAANNRVILKTTTKGWMFSNDGDLTLPAGGDILDSNGNSVLGGGGAGTTQPYLELTDTPFITQPVTLDTPVTAIADLRGQDALVEVVIGEGPVIESITVTTPGILYVVGQRYRINYWQVGGNSDNGNIDFEVATVGAGGALLTVANAAFEGPAQVNTGTYSNTSIEYRPTEFDVVGTGLTLTRGLYGGLFNSEEEFSYNSSVSPAGTLWNADGWGTLVGFNTRTYDTFNSILTGPDNTPPGELIMWDTINDKYYKFAINIWGVDNNEFSYTRTLITDPNYFKKDDYATANDVDVIEDDSTLQIGITRGLNGGIYNPFTEEDWNSNVSPDGTLWNTDGWNDLTDVESRNYTNFYTAYDQQLGNLVPGSQAVMYVPSIEKYYAIGWISWTQGINGNTQGGGFSYTRREIDLTKLDQGVRFADGTVQTTAYTSTNVLSTAPRDRRIETASGYKEVSFTAVTTSNTYNPISIARPGGAYDWDLYIDRTTNPVLEAAINLYGQYGGEDHSWRVTINGQVYTNDQLQVYLNNDYIIIYSGDTNVTLPGDAGISVTIERITGNIPVVWWNKTDLPGGAGDFRGAVIDYHAYTGSGTIIGTIHIVDDDGENYITHTEVSSGSNSSMNDNLWIVTNEGQIKYARFDLEARTLKIHWTAKVFYGSELYD